MLVPAGATQIAEVRVRDPTAESEMLPVIEGAHATRRWGLRFVDDAVEDAYRLWFEQQAVQLTRIGALVASFGWVMTVVVVGIALPERMAWLLGWVLLVVMPGILAAVAASYVPAWRSRMLPLTALSIALAGLVLVGPHLAVGLDQPEATGGTIVVLLFAFTIFRLTLVQALLATIPFVVLDVGIAWAHFQRGELDLTQGVIHTTLPAGVFVLGAAVHLLRSRLLRDAFRKEQIIAQQHEVITRERDRADQLLLNILPRETATQLKSGARVIADAHEDVTVLFADLVGFTRIAATLEPQDLVAYLDDLFSRFDRLADELGVEKIRTMGDGYLAVGGLPTPRPRPRRSGRSARRGHARRGGRVP